MRFNSDFAALQLSHQRKVKKAAVTALQGRRTTVFGSDFGASGPAAEIPRLFWLMFRRAVAHETILRQTKPFFAFGAELRKRQFVIKPSTSGGDADRNAGDSQMRTLSFILAFAFVMAGPSMAGSADNGSPGIGTFSYNGSPISAPTLMAAN